MGTRGGKGERGREGGEGRGGRVGGWRRPHFFVLP